MVLRHEHWVAFVTIASLRYKSLSMKRVLFARVDNFSRTVEVNVVPVIILISKVSKKKFDHMTHQWIKLHSLSPVLFTSLTSAYIVMIIHRTAVSVALFPHFFVFRKALYSGCSLSLECKCNGPSEMKSFL